MVGAQQAPKDTDGCLKKINVHVLVEGELLFYPVLCFCKLYMEWKQVWKGKKQKRKGLNSMPLILKALLWAYQEHCESPP